MSEIRSYQFNSVSLAFFFEVKLVAKLTLDIIELVTLKTSVFFPSLINPKACLHRPLIGRVARFDTSSDEIGLYFRVCLD